MGNIQIFFLPKKKKNQNIKIEMGSWDEDSVFWKQILMSFIKSHYWEKGFCGRTEKGTGTSELSDIAIIKLL